MKKTNGEIAYEAYCQAREWKSIRGEPLPAFKAQDQAIIEAWEKAGDAVAESIRIETGRG